MYEINFHTKISSAWFTGLSIVFSSFSGFWSVWEYEIKFHTKGFGRKSTKNFAYENFFLYSSCEPTQKKEKSKLSTFNFLFNLFVHTRLLFVNPVLVLDGKVRKISPAKISSFTVVVNQLRRKKFSFSSFCSHSPFICQSCIGLIGILSENAMEQILASICLSCLYVRHSSLPLLERFQCSGVVVWLMKSIFARKRCWYQQQLCESTGNGRGGGGGLYILSCISKQEVFLPPVGSKKHLNIC